MSLKIKISALLDLLTEMWLAEESLYLKVTTTVSQAVWVLVLVSP